MSLAGLSPENHCAGEAQQDLKIADPFSLQRERPTIQRTQMFEDNFQGREKKLSQVPDCGLALEQTGRLAVGRKITLTLT
jgi:hypothetical protein